MFHRAIGEGGNVLAEWALDSGDIAKNGSMEVAKFAGCPTQPYDALLNCVRTIDGHALSRAYFQYTVIATNY